MDRRVIAHTPPPPRAAPVTARIDAIKRNNGQPLGTQQLRQIAPAATVAAGAAAGRGQPQRVTVVGQGGAKPQPLPLRGTVNANGAQTGQTGVPQRGTPITTSPATNNNANANVNGRIQNATTRNATVQQGQKPTNNGVPSSQFAPHAGQPRTTTNNERVVTHNPNTATVHDKAVNGRTTVNGAQGNGSQTRSTTTTNNAGVSNNTGRGTATVHAPPQNHTPQVERKVINDSSTHNPNNNNPNGSQPHYTPRTESRSVQQQQHVQQQQYTPRTNTPAQPQMRVAQPQPQVQHAPVQQEHRAPPPRDKNDKDKD
jgi:hypothetical protein